MSTALATRPVEPLMTLDPKIIESLVLNGDLSKLNPVQKVQFYSYKCQQAGLDPAAKPFDLLTLNGKQILYANAACTQQLTANRKLSHQVTNRVLEDGIYCVFVRVTDSEGRSTENMGAVPVEGLKGEQKANAMMKATTKGIRRTVLAHCGLGMLDETETETIPGAKVEPFPAGDNVDWTSEERQAAKGMVNDFGQILMDAGLTEEAIAVILDPKNSRQMNTLYDSETPFEKWANRWTTWSREQIKKHVPEAK